ncbi:hypothetical protein Pyn_09712 [Prunus yedoensis var. nudiflora]|uniref:Uncharacterized protein n=1 Tax=Prunus yedoensis var. nudiflora TaxID=2094558 RepID=A0A314V032_PRUYE|nr:hypothetical protein Pyn_09712 [Prunus yedoensis var. nudiflora]
MEYTNHSYKEQTAFEPELPNFLPLLSSDRGRSLGINIIWWRSHLVSFKCNPIARTMEYTNHSYKERTASKPELSNFLPRLISDRAQNLGITIIWWKESSGEFSVKSNRYNYAIHQPLQFGTNCL